MTSDEHRTSNLEHLSYVRRITSPAAAGPITGRATVVDGDTISVEGAAARIRLYGIDAPESRQTCDDANGKRYLCGSRAAAALAEIVGRNGRVTCFEEDRDRYGRIVAECSTDGNVVLNAAMIEAGWAVEHDAFVDGMDPHCLSRWEPATPLQMSMN